MTLLNLIRLERKTSKTGKEYFTGVVVADHEITLQPGDRVTAFHARKEASDGQTFNLTSERYEFQPNRRGSTPSPARAYGQQGAADPEGATTTAEAKARYAKNGRWKPQDSRTEVLGYGHTARTPKPAQRDPEAATSRKSKPKGKLTQRAVKSSIQAASGGAPTNERRTYPPVA